MQVCLYLLVISYLLLSYGCSPMQAPIGLPSMIHIYLISTHTILFILLLIYYRCAEYDSFQIVSILFISYLTIKINLFYIEVLKLQILAVSYLLIRYQQLRFWCYSIYWRQPKYVKCTWNLYIWMSIIYYHRNNSNKTIKQF